MSSAHGCSHALSALAGFQSADHEGPCFGRKGRIDELLSDRWKQLGIQPANLCSDGVFVRQVYLDVTGTLPTAREARQFLQDPDPNKRAALIDRLLQREEFADYWAMKWSDLLRVKAEFPINLWPRAVHGYHRWIRSAGGSSPTRNACNCPPARVRTFGS